MWGTELGCLGAVVGGSQGRGELKFMEGAVVLRSSWDVTLRACQVREGTNLSCLWMASQQHFCGPKSVALVRHSLMWTGRVSPHSRDLPCPHRLLTSGIVQAGTWRMGTYTWNSYPCALATQLCWLASFPPIKRNADFSFLFPLLQDSLVQGKLLFST